MTTPPGTGTGSATEDEPQFIVPIPDLPATTRGESTPAPAALDDTTPLSYAAEPGQVDDMGGASAEVDSRSSRFGAALFWITVGWWIFVGVRFGEKWIRSGYSDHILYDTVAMVKEEPLIAAGFSVLAALVLLLSSGRRLLGALALALSGATVAVAAWRLMP